MTMAEQLQYQAEVNKKKAAAKKAKREAALAAEPAKEVKPDLTKMSL